MEAAVPQDPTHHTRARPGGPGLPARANRDTTSDPRPPASPPPVVVSYVKGVYFSYYFIYV